MKKLLVKLATGVVLDVLIQVAQKEYAKEDRTQDHYDRWRTILSFLIDMKTKGLPL